jgi:hypothetical protein
MCIQKYILKSCLVIISDVEYAVLQVSRYSLQCNEQQVNQYGSIDTMEVYISKSHPQDCIYGRLTPVQ